MQKLTKEKQLETILVMCLGGTVLYAKTQNKYLLGVVLVIGIGALLLPKMAYGVSWAWMKLGEAMGAVSSKVILSAIYFLVLVPIAFLSRLFQSGQSAWSKPEGNESSYYYTRNHRYTSKDLQNPW